MKPKTKLTILALSIIPPILVWLPFLLRLEEFMGIPIKQGGMQTIVSNYDGPLYIVVAKSLYNLQYISQNFALDLPLEYYAAHFPLFPLQISVFAQVLGYPWGMMIATLFGSIVANYFFYKLAREILKDSQKALTLSFFFAFVPARWLIVRSVGSPEPFFIGSILAGVFYFRKQKYWLAGFWGVLAQLTKSPGILLFIALCLSIGIKEFSKLASTKQSIRSWFAQIEYKTYPIALVPISLLGLFAFYSSGSTFSDFFAYFNSGDNIHLFFPPFQIFDYTQSWVNTFWLEEIIFIYTFILSGLLVLINQKKIIMASFVGVFFLSIVFVSHRDIMRYSLPVVPFLLIAFSDILLKKQARIAALFLAIPIFLYALAFISGNTMPIVNWQPYL